MPRRGSQLHSSLRLTDLAGERPQQEKLLSVRLPLALLDALDRTCHKLGARKAEVVVALLNEGLERLGKVGAPAKAKKGPRAKGKRARRR